MVRQFRVPPDREGADRQLVGHCVLHDRGRVERREVGHVGVVDVEDVGVDVRPGPALLGVVGVDLRLIPRDLPDGVGVLVLVDHAEGMAELVTHDALVLAGGRVRFEPAVVHRRLGARHGQGVGADRGPGEPFLGEADPQLGGAAGDEAQRQVGDGLPLLGDGLDLPLHLRHAVEEAHPQGAAVLPQLEPLDRGAGPARDRRSHRDDADVVDPFGGGDVVTGAVRGGARRAALGEDGADLRSSPRHRRSSSHAGVSALGGDGGAAAGRQ